MAVGYCITGSAVRSDGGIIVTPQANSIVSTRWEEGTEIFGVGIGVDALPKTGLVTIDQINASATRHMQPTGVIAKVTSSLAGVANSTVQKMDQGQTLNSPKRDSLGSNLVATAVRNNQWSTQSGVFSTAPTVATQAWGTDFSSVPTGGINSTYGTKFRMMAGSKTPSGATYKGSTVW